MAYPLINDIKDVAEAIIIHGTNANPPIRAHKIVPLVMFMYFGHIVVTSFAKETRFAVRLHDIWVMIQITEQTKARNRPPPPVHLEIRSSGDQRSSP